MLPLETLFIRSTDSKLLGRFTAAVKKRAFAIADEQDHTTPRWKTVQQIAKARGHQPFAQALVDYAISQSGNPLSEKVDELTDDEVEAVVAGYVVKVLSLVG